ncbi:MAG: hypothetical protein LIO87_03025 [Eubacterium sp.]|nr:hypothetical protein [Eubacterium sp.]
MGGSAPYLASSEKPLIDTLGELAESGSITAANQYAVYNDRGDDTYKPGDPWVTHHNFDLWRGTQPIDNATAGLWPTGGAWLLDHAWQYYQYNKVCPNPWCVLESRLTYWQNFKARLKESEVDDEVIDTTSILINGKSYTVNRILKDNKNYICLSDLAGKGFDVGYNSTTKTPSLDNTINEINVSVDGVAKNLKAINIGGSNFSKLRDTISVCGNMEIDYKDSMVIINTKTT